MNMIGMEVVVAFAAKIAGPEPAKKRRLWGWRKSPYGAASTLQDKKRNLS
jgi:hypothetical protein